MKFIYEYRTSDNIRHEGVVAAANRDAAFAALKAQGIRPGSLRDAPGFFNKLFGKGKRWIAIVMLAILALVSMCFAFISGKRVSDAGVVDTLDSPMRRQLIGDTAVIEKGIRTGWANVFDLEGDRFLASFAIPGVQVAVKTTTEDKLKEALASDFSLKGQDNIAIETRQIVSIVNGMKAEFRRFLAAKGTIREYCGCLVERQEREIGYYNRIKTELDTAAKSGMPEADLEDLWEARNDSLRAMGIKLVAMPD